MRTLSYEHVAASYWRDGVRIDWQVGSYFGGRNNIYLIPGIAV
uniref:Uncharacterized protein n=1 Tax=Rhizobium rhizogenes TaxID=359 RepID=A0A7S4ZT12_RHIRH|nr:hypothetical protein pC5.7b_347 [Rhizobium rhizogenes]